MIWYNEDEGLSPHMKDDQRKHQDPIEPLRLDEWHDHLFVTRDLADCVFVFCRRDCKEL